MGIFDKLKNTAVNAAVQSSGNERVPFTYFAGSTPENNYTPTEPYSITVESNHVSAEEAGYMKHFIPCGGADSQRPIKLR